MGKLGFDFGLGLSSQILEFINGVLFVVCLWMTASVAAYLCRERRRFKGFRAMFQRGDHTLSISLFLFVTGATVIHAAVWYVRHLINHGYIVVPMKDDNFLTLLISIGTVLCCWGGICTIRAMMPAHYGQWPWLAMSATSFAFGIFTAWYL